MELKIPYQKDLSLPPSPTGRIDHFLWLNNGCAPESGFYLCYNEEALKIRLFSKEYPRFVRAKKDDGAIWEDNCLEFFLAPFGKDQPYINFECNPLGKMIIGFGHSRHDRRLITAALKPKLGLKAAVFPDSWQIEYSIPFCEISALFGQNFEPKSGKELFFNAYLCGDMAEPPRYGAWSRIDLPEPDFHCPAFFGKGVLQ